MNKKFLCCFALCVFCIINLNVFAKSEVKYILDEVDGETGAVTFQTDPMNLGGIFDANFLSFYYDKNGILLSYEYNEYDKNDVKKPFSLRLKFSDNSAYTLDFNGLDFSPKKINNPGNERHPYFYHYIVMVYCNSEVMNKFVNVPLESIRTSSAGGFFKLSSKKAEKLQLIASDFAGRLSATKANTNSLAVTSGIEESPSVTTVKYTKDLIDEFTNEREIETQAIKLSHNEFSCGFGLKNTTFYLNFSFYKNNYSYVTGGDYMKITFEDRTMNYLRFTKKKETKRLEEKKYLLVADVECDKDLIEKFSKKKIVSILYMRPGLINERSGNEVLYKVINKEMATNFMNCAADFFSKIKDVPKTTESSIYPDKQYPVVKLQGDYERAEVEESKWNWEFLTEYRLLDKHMSFRLHYYKELIGQKNSHYLVNVKIFLPYPFGINRGNEIYLKLEDNSILKIKYDSYSDARKDYDSEYYYLNADFSADRTLFEALAKNKITKIRVVVENMSETPYKDQNEEILVDEASAKMIQIEAQEITKYVPAVK